MPINITYEFVMNLIEQNAKLTSTVSELNATIEQLNQTIKELQEKLNKNSKNSSKPPSSDGYNKPPADKNNKDTSLREKTGKKQGAQDGHKGSNLSVLSKPDQTINHMHSDCGTCPNRDKCLLKACTKETRHEVDIVVNTTVTEHKLIEVPECPLHGGKKAGEFPPDIKATVQYGKNLQALAVAFNTVGAVSVKRTHEILSGVFDIPLATGTISNFVSRFADIITPSYDKIKDNLIAAGLLHCDETGTRVEGKTWWVHNASNRYYTFLTINTKRGRKGMDDAGILPVFEGIIVHDCWGSYWQYDGIEHAICCAHLLRELNGVIENHPEQEWAPKFKNLLLEMKNVRDKAVLKGTEKLSDYYIRKFGKQYDEIIKTAYAENPLPEKGAGKRGRTKRTKTLNLVCRLDKYKESVCLFIKNLSVPFDNNQAERDLRMVKVKTKVSGCFRTEDGATEYLKIMSYIGTAHKHGINAFNAIREALNGNLDIIFA